MASDGAETRNLSCYINIIPDTILAKIFSYLPLKERLHLSEVCSRWHSVTHLDWLDVVDLDLTPIPSPNIGAILRLSPNVESIFALRRFLILNDLTDHYQVNLTSVKLHDVKMGLASITGHEKHTDEYRNLINFNKDASREFLVDPDADLVNADKAATAIDAFHQFSTALNQFFEKMPELDELVAHNLVVSDLSQLPALSIVPFEIQRGQLRSLSRLQLSGSGTRVYFHARLLIESLRNLQSLECLVLQGRLVFEAYPFGSHQEMLELKIRNDTEFYDAVASLKSLRELSLAIRTRQIIEFGSTTSVYHGDPFLTADIAFQLPKLEILFLIDTLCREDTFTKLFTIHPKLRILMITGAGQISYAQTRVPMRKFQATATSDPLSFLSVFLGQKTYRNLRFALSPAAEIFKIDRPIQEFFKIDEIADILDGVWVAEMITETASYDPELWRRPEEQYIL